MLSVEQRLDLLEANLSSSRRRERRWRFAALAAGGALAAGALGALASPRAALLETVRTNRLEIVDEGGKPVLVATSAAQGGQIDFWNRAGANTMRLGSSEFGGDVTLWNEKGKQVVAAFATSDGGRFESSWSDGRPGFRAGVSREGAAVSISNSDGREVLYAGTTKSAGGQLIVKGTTGDPVAGVAAGIGGGVFESFTHDGGLAATIGAAMSGEAGMIQVSGPNPAVTPAGAAVDKGASMSIFEVSARSDGAGRVTIGDTGVANIVIEASAQDSGLISLLMAGKRVVALGTGTAGGQLNLNAADTKPAVVLGAASDAQGGAVSVRGPDGQPVVRMSADPRGDGEVAIYSAGGGRKRVFNTE